MSTKAITTRIQNKHDLEANWLQAKSFVPYQGELIIYDVEVDANGNNIKCQINGVEKDACEHAGRTTPYTYERFKIGDGKKTVSDLPFSVNNATLTIQKNGTNVATFTANSSTNQTANIVVPTGAAADKGVDTSISAASTSTNLPTSKAVADFVYKQVTAKVGDLDCSFFKSLY